MNHERLYHQLALMSSRQKRTRSPGCKTTTPAALVCNPQLRDPLTIAYSYCSDPTPLRRTCRFMALCWEHAVYLEGDLPCPFVTAAAGFQWPDCLVHPPVLLTEGANKLLYMAPVSRVVFTRIPGLEAIADDAMEGPCGERINFWKLPERPACADTLDVTSLPRLTRIGNSFTPRHIIHLTLQDLPNLETIDKWFCYACRSLKEFELTDLPRLTCLGEQFMQECSRLRRVTLSRLPRLTTVGVDALADCALLEELHLSHLPKLVDQGIGEGFLEVSATVT